MKINLKLKKILNDKIKKIRIEMKREKKKKGKYKKKKKERKESHLLPYSHEQ